MDEYLIHFLNTQTARSVSPPTDLLLIEEIEGFALVAWQLLQRAAPLLHGRLEVSGGHVVLDVHRRLQRRLLGRRARRAEQTAETGCVRVGKWEEGDKRKAHRQTYRGGWTQAAAAAVTLNI